MQDLYFLKNYDLTDLPPIEEIKQRHASPIFIPKKKGKKKNKKRK